MINGINLNDQVQNQITFQPSINTVSGVQGRQLRRSAPNTAAARARWSTSPRARAPTTCTARSSSSSAHESLDARNFFNPESQQQSPFKRHQFGANLGGPIAEEQDVLLRHLRGAAPAPAARLQQRRAERRPAGGGDRPRGAQPAAADPGRQRDRAPRARPASSARAPPTWTSTSGPATSTTSSARTTACTPTTPTSATSAASRTCRATPSPASATRARRTGRSGP